MYGYSKKTDLDFDDAVARVRVELEREGFGVLTEIDVRQTLKKKLDIDFDDYIILGACNPPLAYEALKAEREIGLLLPCNVIVYVSKGETHVSAILPTIAMSMVDNPDLKETDEKVESKLKKVVDSV